MTLPRRGASPWSAGRFSVSEELRASLYGAVAAATTGVGILLKDNLQRIGPLSIISALAVVAAGCYASPIRTRLRHETRSAVGDYLLLLGALIVSADLGYAESQFHWLGSHWSRHLLILCAVHALTVYALDSRLVLSLSLTTLAAWFGLEGNVVKILREGNVLRQSGVQALVCTRRFRGTISQSTVHCAGRAGSVIRDLNRCSGRLPHQADEGNRAKDRSGVEGERCAG